MRTLQESEGSKNITFEKVGGEETKRGGVALGVDARSGKLLFVKWEERDYVMGRSQGEGAVGPCTAGSSHPCPTCA